MKPKYLLTIGDKVKTRRGVIGIIIKIENEDYFTLELPNKNTYRCVRNCCTYMEN